MSEVLPGQRWDLLASAAGQPRVNPAGVSDHLSTNVYHWMGFGVLVVILLLFDLLVFHRHDRKPTLRESVGFTIFWIAMGLIFNGVIWWWGAWEGLGSGPGLTFLSGYLVEKSLSMDNIFVFVVIFRLFSVPLMYQYRVLFAFDSVPAIFGITQDAFIIFTSNIFAILGLRALYFLLAGVIEMFRHVHYGLARIIHFRGNSCASKGV